MIKKIIENTRTDENEFTHSEIYNEDEKLYNFKYFNPLYSNFYYVDTMKFHNSIYYKVIDDYQKYLIYKNNYQNILDMSEIDFTTQFMVLTVTENESTKNLALESITSDDTTLYIGLNKKKSNEECELDRGISIKIDRSLLRKDIDVYKSIEDMTFINNYENIKNLPKNYTIEEAITDKCLVTTTNPANNIDVFENFIDDVNNNKDTAIRVISKLPITEDNIIIYDIKYSSLTQKYYVCIDTSRSTNYSNTYNYFEYDSLKQEDLTKSFFRDSDKISSYKFYNNEFPETNIIIQFYNSEY